MLFKISFMIQYQSSSVFFDCFLWWLPSWFIYWFILDQSPKCMDTTMSIINSFILLNESYLALVLQVVLASVPDLQCGFSRDLFLAWCGSPKNSIILTNRTSPGTLARWLIDNPENKTVTMDVRKHLIKFTL